MRPAIYAALAASLLAGCISEPAPEELDPALEAFDDGKYDGPVVGLEAGQTYAMEVRKIETTEDYGAWTVQPDVYLKVADARSPVCPSADNCNFDLADVPAPLNVSTRERAWSAEELRNGVTFEVHERRFDSGGNSIADEIKGLTRIRIGQTGSLRIKPFGKVKSIEFRVKF